MSPFGKKLDKQAQDLAYTIYQYFKKKTEDPTSTEYKRNMKIIPTVAEATGLTEKTIIKIISNKMNKSNDGDQSNSSKFKRFLYLDNLEKCEIKRKMIQFYSLYKKVPTLMELNSTFIEENILICTASYLQRLFKDMGLRYVTCKSDHRIVLERASVTSARQEYLNNVRKFRTTGRPIIFVSETYISTTQKANIQKAQAYYNNKEGGLIAIHAASRDGFLKGAHLILQSKLSRKQYYKDMNSENFSWWVKEKLLPNLPPQSVVVMNNAGFNSDAVRPNCRSSKLEIEAWLKSNKVEMEENLRKSELLALVDNHKSSGDNTLDGMLKKHGHEVLRIPKMHYDLNIIEWIWRNVKGQVWSEKDIKSSRDEKCHVLEKILSDHPTDDWKRAEDQVKLLEEEYYQYQLTLDQVTDDMLEKIQNKEIAINSDEDSDLSDEEMEISEEEK